MAFVDEAFAPVLHPSAEAAGERAGGDLHPGPAPGQAHEQVVMVLDPGQALGMGDHRDDAGGHQLEHHAFEVGRGHVVRRFQQQVARTGQGRDAAAADALEQAQVQVHVGTFDQAQGDAFLIQLRLQGGDGRHDAVAGVVVQARVDVRGAGHRGDAVGGGHARHVQRHGQIGGAVVDGRQQVVVQVKHAVILRRRGRGPDLRVTAVRRSAPRGRRTKP